jgi:molybdate transport system substrate-binding protein
VRQVLTYVERGEVAAGVVYATDALESGNKVRVVATADPKTHETIVYPGIVISATKKPGAAGKFLDYLGGADATKVLRAKGFVIPSAAAAGDAKSGGPAK